MGRVESFAGLAHAKAFDGLRQDHGGRTRVRNRGRIGGIDLLRIMTAAIEVPNLLIRHVGDHFLELRILAEEMLARVSPALGLEILILAIHALFHDTLQKALLIGLQQRIPASAPKNLDDIPTRAEESR